MFKRILQYKPTEFTLRYAKFVLLCLVPLNLVIWYISTTNGIERSYFNIDFAIPVILSVFFIKLRLSKFVFLTSYFAIFIFDIAKTIMVRFGFEEGIFNTAKNFGDISLSGIIYKLYLGNIHSEIRNLTEFNYILVALTTISILALIFKKIQFSRIFSALLSILILYILVVHSDLIFLLSALISLLLFSISFAFSGYLKTYTSKSDILVFALIVFYSLFLAGVSNRPQNEQRNFFSNFTTFVVLDFKIEEKEISSATSELFKTIKLDKKPEYDNIILIIVESLGMLKVPEDMQKILEPFSDSDLISKYEVITDGLKYKGHTTTAEFRELCQWQVNGLPNVINKQGLEECLPLKLQKMGYRTDAIHNTSKYIFSRNEWWPYFGFDEIHFFQDMKDRFSYEKYCDGGDGYEAICEKDILQTVIPNMLSSKGKNFVYFLTVESHTPIDEDVPISEEFSKVCKQIPALEENKALCRIFDITNNLFVNTISFAKSISGQKNLIIIVGDHNPPFFRVSLNAQYDRERVPVIILRSKN